MKRREFITLLGGAAAAWPLAARAQQPGRVRHVQVLEAAASADDPEGQARLAAFQDGLEVLGWTNGRNVSLDVRFSAASPDRLEAIAAETVARAPDVVLVTTTSIATALLRRSTSISVVFVNISDPIRTGLVTSLSRPGGNITGFTNFEASLVEKWLGLLKEVAPKVVRVAVILNPENAASVMFLRLVEASGPTLGIQVTTFQVRDAADIKRAFEARANEAGLGLIVLPEPVAGTIET
jgi:putative tryptophan/tyrosine transport system substrate-binding protein